LIVFFLAQRLQAENVTVLAIGVGNDLDYDQLVEVALAIL
jgi:hypothetical protein